MNLYLIAHKVRGEPAFDIAEKMQCPICEGHSIYYGECSECDGDGHWWIVSTSGHRAYPYNWAYYEFNSLLPPGNEMPEPLPDHYPTRSSPKSDPSSGKSLLAALGLIPKVVRRL